MNVKETKEQLIAELIRLAFAEDIGDGDHTTLYSGYGNGKKPVNRERRWCFGRSGNGPSDFPYI